MFERLIGDGAAKPSRTAIMPQPLGIAAQAGFGEISTLIHLSNVDQILEQFHRPEDMGEYLCQLLGQK